MFTGRHVFRSLCTKRTENWLTGLVVERKERKNDEGPLVYRYETIPAVNEGIAPPFLGEVDVANKFRTIKGPLDSSLGIVSGLLKNVLYGLFGRLEVPVRFRGDDLVQHLIEQEERGHRGVSGVDLGRG